ncbi:hypothetical protein [Legionella resiliens]|uniref:Uncharacterized protein n=1 Tax=Legionella resiliens TaxID=2905958 RepID=A0ABS8X533_9GAMM|nr:MULTISPECIES: hypothetical protein [unclassified Legionella]MCE0722806.1 hypothetical protein [Legionella sp. 9fVS26]MCE3531959.1 hypothetical protein [Legionella sp. 8cVS16]
METYNVYLIRFCPWPDESHRKEGFKSIQEARDYIKNPVGSVVGHMWVIIKIPDSGNRYELIEHIPKNY